MKAKSTILIFLLLVFAGVRAQSIQSLFDKYADDERFQYVSVGKGMTNIASVFAGRAKYEKQMMAKMKGIKILTLESTANSPIAKSFEKELDQVIANGKFESVVEVREKNERVNIYYQVTGKDNADMLIVTKEKGEFSIIWISGKMTKDEMMKTFSCNGHEIKTYEHRKVMVLHLDTDES